MKFFPTLLAVSGVLLIASAAFDWGRDRRLHPFIGVPYGLYVLVDAARRRS